MLVTDQAKLIRLPIEFRHLVEGGFDRPHGLLDLRSRTPPGVRIFNVAKGEQIVGAALIDETEEPENPAEEASRTRLPIAVALGRTTPHTTCALGREYRRRARQRLTLRARIDFPT